MTWSRALALVAGGGALVVVACQKVPYTGRRQFNLIPNGIMSGVGSSSYQAMLSEVRVKKKGPDNAVLQRVGDGISKAAREPDFAWEYSLIDADEVNAWCLPGGYIGFNTGILPVLENESGMAFVMGHEVAHATAHHGAERMSQQLALVGGLAGLELFMANRTEMPAEQRAIVLGALGVGGQLAVLLPFSRTHESEADTIGMMYMAQAGYPPREGQDVWERMGQLSPNNVPTFLSTHPSHDQRKANLKEWLPVARKKFERNRTGRDGLLEPIWR